jgi:AbrB family looped-hinge helix DNA binding protein
MLRVKTTAILSTKGQLILPHAIRTRRRWSAGTRLTVEETAEGVLLKPEPLFPPTRPEDVFGSLKTRGKPKSVEDMSAGVAAELKRRHARHRY